MYEKRVRGKKGSEEVTVKLKGEVLEKVLKMRGERERETKKATSIAEVVKEIILKSK